MLTPDPVTGLLPNSYNVPLEVTLLAEGHTVDVLLDFEELQMAEHNGSGILETTGVRGLGLNVRIVGLPGTATDGLEYQATTSQNLNGETYAPFFNAFLPGRYRVYVDGISTEQVREITDPVNSMVSPRVSGKTTTSWR